MLFHIRMVLARLLFHPLEGLRHGQWRELLVAEGYRWSWRYLPKIVLLYLQTSWQSHFARRVEHRYGAPDRRPTG